jgi:hypothetical protein
MRAVRPAPVPFRRGAHARLAIIQQGPQLRFELVNDAVARKKSLEDAGAATSGPLKPLDELLALVPDEGLRGASWTAARTSSSGP